MKKHRIMTLTLYHIRLVHYFIASKKKKKRKKQRFILAQLTGVVTGDWVGNSGNLSACADFISDVIAKKDRDIEIRKSKLFCSFHRVIVASLETQLKLCVAQKIGVSRKSISQGFEKLCKRNRMNKKCVLEYSYICEEVSNELVFLPRWQNQNKIMF